LKIKTNLHRWEIEKICQSLDSMYLTVQLVIQNVFDSAQKNFKECKILYKKFDNNLSEMKKDVVSVQKIVEDARKPRPLPKEPVSQELQQLPYVPNLPKTGFRFIF
jgi:hypothetical protein